MGKLKNIFGAIIITLVIVTLYSYPRDIYSKRHVVNFLLIDNQSNLIAVSLKPKTEPIEIKDLNKIKRLVPCDDVTPYSHYGQRGSYWVLYNYVIATVQPSCDQSITYTTHADFTFLDNLVPLVERWRGPISVAVYAPGKDLEETLKRIQYLRLCTTPLIKEFVNFHLFFDLNKTPPKIPPSISQFDGYICDNGAPLFGHEVNTTFRKSNKLLYPVNVARNLARDMAPTHFVLASDIELYPSPNLIPEFLEMIKNSENGNKTNPQLWVLPIFEVDGSIPLTELPLDKGQLQNMLNKTTAIPFHKFICSFCHKIPRQDRWIAQKYELGEELKIFYTGKRKRAFRNWEPIYIGTKLDPGYDERLSWEGQRDKMTQGYILCVKNYDFNILNNAFLVHRPGIKKPTKVKKTKQQNLIASKQNSVIKNSIILELKILYGSRAGCVV